MYVRQLTNWNKSYVGKVPQSGYCIQFDDATVDVSAKGGDGSPCFRTTMSAGDKSTLALAFFLAQITRDAEISKKIVVFDDPFSSLDDFRREMTAKNVVRCGEKATQVIVLSHDKYFLDVVRRKIHGAGCVPMQISCTRGNSSLEPWDIEREVRDGYLQDHMALVEFSEGLTSDAKVARMLMRPLLEKYIRYRFPNQIDDGKWLGDMCSIIREDTAHPLQHFYNDLDDINQYTAPFHHDPDAPFNPDEVMNYVKRTLAIVGGA
jgi:wobble nucleotide-excising tRNase